MRRYLPVLAAGLVAVLAAGCSTSPAVDGAAAGSTATVTVVNTAPADPTAVAVRTTVTAIRTMLTPTTIRVPTTVPVPTTVTVTVTSTATETLTGGAPEQAADAPTPQAPAPDPATPQAIVQPPAVQVPFANCTEAKAAGAAPVYRGEPGYADKLDRDGDGVGCES